MSERPTLAETYLAFPACDRASHDQTMPSYASVPLGSYSLDLHILEASILKPLHTTHKLGCLQCPRTGLPLGKMSGQLYKATKIHDTMFGLTQMV